MRDVITCTMLNRVITLSPPQKLHLPMFPIISTSFCRRTNRLSIKGENFSKYRKLKVPGSNNPPPLRGLTGHHKLVVTLRDKVTWKLESTIICPLLDLASEHAFWWFPFLASLGCLVFCRHYTRLLPTSPPFSTPLRFAVNFLC